MRNRFNINESEKNRIRALHGMQVINEQTTDFEIANYNKKKWGTDNHGSVTQQWLDELAENAKKMFENIGLVGQTVNLYHSKPYDGIGGGTTEADVIGQYTVTSIEFRPDEAGAFIAFKATQGESGEPTRHDQWAWYSCEDYSLKLADEKGKYNEEGMAVENIKFVNALHKAICSSVGALREYFTYKEYIETGDEKGKKWQIVDDADFASTDQGDQGGLS